MSDFSCKNKRRACFLDRDGIVNVEVSYLHEPEKTVLETGIVEALKAIHKAGFLAVVVTNQAGVARGKYPESDIAKVHEKLQALLAACGEKIDAFYYCPTTRNIPASVPAANPIRGCCCKRLKNWI